MTLSLKGADLRAACARLRAYLEVSDDEAAIARELGLSWSDYEELRRAYYALEESDLRKRSGEQWFVDYVNKQRRNQADLTRMIELFESTKQFNAMIGAVKARADINDKIIERGQEFGFISKTPEVKAIIHGTLRVDQMSNAELRGYFESTMKASAALVARYGTEDRPIIDVTPGKVHRAELIPNDRMKPVMSSPMPSVRTGDVRKQHARNRVHKGRRVEKTKA